MFAIRLRSTLVVALLAIVTGANATITFYYNEVFTGGTPVGTPPWATLTIENDGSNQVKFTLTNNLDPATGQFISDVKLNLLPPLSSYDPVTPVTGFTPIATYLSYDFGEDAITGQGENFDYRLYFQTSNAADRLIGGDSVSWDMIGTGLDETDFLSYSTPQAGNPGLLSLIHVQSIPPTGDSSWDVGVVPEPTGLAAASIGVLALLRRKRR